MAVIIIGNGKVRQQLATSRAVLNNTVRAWQSARTLARCAREAHRKWRAPRGRLALYAYDYGGPL